MSRANGGGSWGGAGMTGFGLAVMVAAAVTLNPVQADEGDAPKLTFYPSLQLKFVEGEARNYFISQAGVVNVSGTSLSGLTFRQRFPSGFTASLISPEAQTLFTRPEGFSERLEGNVYTMVLPELRIAEATALVVRLEYQGRPGEVTFPGIEVEFTSDAERHTEKGPDLTWDLHNYTRYSGTLREFIKRHAGLDLRIPGGEWGFTNLAARVAGKVTTGPVEIDTDRSGRMRFSLAAGEPGDMMQLLVIRRPYDPARHELKAKDEVRRLAMDSVAVTADFTLDPDEFSIEKKKVGRYQAWVAETRWRDKVKDRFGEGPSRWFMITDEKGGNQYIINISAQGRGAGPGKADVPNPGKEQELLSELQGIVDSLRIL